PDGQQVQVMVAQYRNSGRAQGFYKPQTLQGLRAPIDQVAGKPELIPGRVELNLLQQALQGVETALQITDGVDRHSDSSILNPLMERPRKGQHEAGYFRIEQAAIVGAHLVAALHGPHFRGQDTATGIVVAGTWFNRRLLANHAFSPNLLHLTMGIRDNPVTGE